jgi:transcriptional regulator
MAKLHEDDVKAIRRLRREGETLAEIAERYSITAQNVVHISKRHTWRHCA